MRDVGLNAAIKAVGNMAKLANGLNITRAAVSQWDRVPADRVADVERITGIPRHVLRSDLYPAHREAAA
jgi:DNA-binding transcriptional regulator YdaS (Cro superfamily)